MKVSGTVEGRNGKSGMVYGKEWNGMSSVESGWRSTLLWINGRTEWKKKLDGRNHGVGRGGDRPVQRKPNFPPPTSICILAANGSAALRLVAVQQQSPDRPAGIRDVADGEQRRVQQSWHGSDQDGGRRARPPGRCRTRFRRRSRARR